MTKLYGPLLLLASMALYTIAHSFVKALSGTLSTSFLMFGRFFMGAMILLPLFILGKAKLEFSKPWLLLGRIVFGFIAMYGYFLGLQYSDPGKVSLLFQLSIVWSIILAKLIFKEEPSRMTKGAVVTAFIGLYLVVQPQNMIYINFGDAAALVASVFLAGVVLTLKELRRTQGTFSIIMWTYASAALIAVVFGGTTFTLPASTLHWSYFLGMGAVGLIGQVLMTYGYKFTSASIASSLGLATVPMMYVSGILFFGETVSVSAIFGILIVMTSLFFITRYQ